MSRHGLLSTQKEIPKMSSIIVTKNLNGVGVFFRASSNIMPTNSQNSRYMLTTMMPSSPEPYVTNSDRTAIAVNAPEINLRRAMNSWIVELLEPAKPDDRPKPEVCFRGRPP